MSGEILTHERKKQQAANCKFCEWEESLTQNRKWIDESYLWKLSNFSLPKLIVFKRPEKETILCLTCVHESYSIYQELFQISLVHPLKFLKSKTKRNFSNTIQASLNMTQFHNFILFHPT